MSPDPSPRLQWDGSGYARLGRASVEMLRHCNKWILSGRTFFISSNAVRFPQFQQSTVRVVSPSSFYCTTASYDEFVVEVKQGLKGDLKVLEKQVSLLRAALSNQCKESLETFKMSGSDVFHLAVATFQTAKKCIYTVGERMESAVRLFQHAHDLGHTDASYTYAQLLRTGQGCRPDMKKSAEIMTDLSMKAHPYAQFALATMYYGGLGVDQNFNRAFTLYKVSAQNHVPQAFRALGDMYSNGEGVEQNLEEAFKCYNRAIELGDSLAHMSLANCYNHGKGVEQDFKKMFQHHMKAAENGIVAALHNVATHYFAGKGVDHSFETAIEYFQRASEQGFTPSQVNLGNMYYNGLGVTKDLNKAKELYKLAAEKDKNAEQLLKELEIEETKDKDNLN